MKAGSPTAVRTMLDLLAVARRLLQRLDDERRRGWHDRHLRLTVLDRQLHRDLQTLPVLSRLRDVISHLLRRLE